MPLSSLQPARHLYRRFDQRDGEFSYSETELFGQLCGPGNTVIDIGANIGARTVALSNRVGLGICPRVQPQQPGLQLLCANMVHVSHRGILAKAVDGTRRASMPDALNKFTNFKRWEVKLAA